jgi:hypothetical protein
LKYGRLVVMNMPRKIGAMDKDVRAMMLLLKDQSPRFEESEGIAMAMTSM